MYKIRNKKLALLMTIVFVLTIMMPLATPASAATSYNALTTPTVKAAGVAVADPAQTLGTLHIKVDPLAPTTAAGVNLGSALVSLPDGYILQTINGTAVDRSVGAPVQTITGIITNVDAVITAEGYDTNEFKLDLVSSAASAAGTAHLYLALTVKIPTGKSGDVTANFLNLSGQLPSGSVVVAKLDSGAVTVSGPSSPGYLTSGDTVTFTITENVNGALKLDTDSIKITLPKGFTWNNYVAAPVQVIAGTFPAPGNPQINRATNQRVLEVDVCSLSTAKAVIRVNAIVNVEELDAKYGDIEVTVGGKSSVSPSKILIGKYADFGTKLTVEDTPTILAGRYDVEVGTIVIEETAPYSFIENRQILLTLPAGAKWSGMGTISATDANLHLTAVPAVVNSERTLRITLGLSTATAGKIEIDGASVSTKVNFGANDLTVKVEGSAGITGDVVVGKVVPAITVTAAKPNVKIGVQAQTAGDITITEAQAEALIRNKTLRIAPILDGITFEATPKVEVIEGDLEVSLTKTAAALILNIDAESTVASTIKISGITLTVNRAVPEGNLELAVSGWAVNEVNDTTLAAGVLIITGAPWFENDNTATKAVNAVCVTPAPGDEKQSASFVIGSSNYTINDVEATMDVVPYVKDGRTYLPVRYVGYALGVAPENILWDGKTATLIKGDKVVQVTVGSKAMIVNGANINLDAAPELKDGRTMLPFRWIAWAFGASVNWDGASQTVTMEL